MVTNGCRHKCLHIDKNSLMRALLCELKNVSKEVSTKHVLIMGDFNYADIDWQVGAACHPLTQSTVEFAQTIEDCLYTQHVLCPTRGSAILDIVLSRDPDLVSNVNVLHSLDNSDHNIISFSHGRRSHRSWGGHDPPLLEAKGTGGHNLGIIHLTYCSYHAFTLMSTPTN